MSLAIDRSLRLPETQYFPAPQRKDLVCLHHTVAGSAKGTFRYWRDDPRRIGTAYLVERDGTIYEVFPPDMWCNHLGCKDEGLERRSIGIEIASEGALTAQTDAGILNLYTALGTRLGQARVLRAAGKVERLDTPWRGYRWFDVYDPAQVEATIALVLHLCEEFGIPRRMPTPADCRGDGDLRRWFGFTGVLHHALLRPDKSDLYPGFPFEDLYADLAEAETRAAA